MSESLPAHAPALAAPEDLDERSEQGTLTTENTDYLKTFLPQYHEFTEKLSQKATGVRGTGGVKGDKGKWILKHVFPHFVERFSSSEAGGPTKQSLQKKVTRWFLNRTPKVASSLVPSTAAPSVPKRPRATNASAMFAKTNKIPITELMGDQQAEEGGIPKEVNLRRYHKISKELFDDLPNEERLKYELEASNHNEAIKKLPDESVIFEAQKNLHTNTVKTMGSLIGWNWGQHGDVVLFVQGAYRDAKDELKSFSATVGPDTGSAKLANFAEHLPNYKTVLRNPFREWAEGALPVSKQESSPSPPIQDLQPALAISFRPDGFPLLPAIDFEHVEVRDARAILIAYFNALWGCALMATKLSDPSSLPEICWDTLHSDSERRTKLLTRPELLKDFKSLDPHRMPIREVYGLCELIAQGQNDSAGGSPLQFVISVETTLDSDEDICEFPDPPIQLPTAANNDGTVSRNDQKPSVLPEPLIKAALENVARAGYLFPGLQPLVNHDADGPPTITIDDGDLETRASHLARDPSVGPPTSIVDTPLDADATFRGPLSPGSVAEPLSGQGMVAAHTQPVAKVKSQKRKVKDIQDTEQASKGKKKKLRKEEIAADSDTQQSTPASDTQDSGDHMSDPNSKAKRPRKPMVLPPRAQSGRLSSASYSNKHVNVRQRQP